MILGDGCAVPADKGRHGDCGGYLQGYEGTFFF